MDTTHQLWISLGSHQPFRITYQLSKPPYLAEHVDGYPHRRNQDNNTDDSTRRHEGARLNRSHHGNECKECDWQHDNKHNPRHTS